MRARPLRTLRLALAASVACSFFLAGPLIGLVLLPIVRLAARDQGDYRRRSTRILGRLHVLFAWVVSTVGFVDLPADIPALPALAQGRPYLLVCNHPSILDVVLLLGAYRDLTCVVKRSLYRSFALGSLLRQSAYLEGPARGAPDEPDSDILGAMVDHLQRGHPLLVFPEGTRSPPDRLHRFRRGAIEAALRARVPVVAVFLSTDRPFLTKGTPLWRAPDRPVRYALELLDVLDTRELPLERAAALNADLQQKYRARHAQILDLRRRGAHA